MFSIYRDQTAMLPLRQTWEQADESLQAAILHALHQADQQLQNDPAIKGESRHGKTRILLQAPLAQLFEVDEARKLVRILRAWAYGLREGGPPGARAA
jgi:hypothetical protein